MRSSSRSRSPRSRSPFDSNVLRHLEAAGFDGAPRLLGIDEHGREVLTYIDGKTIDSSPVSLSDRRPVSAAQLRHGAPDLPVGAVATFTSLTAPP